MLYAVLTGDIVGSSQVKEADKVILKDSLKDSFDLINDVCPVRDSLPSFNIFRGDGFQGVIPDPIYALQAGILIRANMRKNQPRDQQSDWDARIALGIGTIDYLPDNVTEGDGPAYRNSGPILDNLKGDIKLMIRSPWAGINDELDTECSLLDAIIAKWTPSQAEVIIMQLKGIERKQMGEILDISQAAIHYRIKGSGWFAVEKLINRYQTLLNKKLTQASGGT